MPAIMLCTALLAALAAPAAPRIRDVRELNTRQIEALDRAKTVVLISGGILEEHGPYLPAYGDGYQTEFLAKRIAEAIAARPGWTVLRFPPLPLGSNPGNEIGRRYSYPGSYSIRAATLRAVVMDLVTDLGDGGFRQIVLVNLHGGPTHNMALDDAARYFNDTYGGRMLHLTGLAKIQGASPGDLFSKEQREREGFSVHADADEHSRMLFLEPGLVARDSASAPPVVGHDLEEPRAIANRSDWTGYFGTPAIASAAAGRKAMDAIAQASADVVLRFLDGAPAETWLRAMDPLPPDPTFRRIVDESTKHEREVERKEEDWLAKRRP